MTVVYIIIGAALLFLLVAYLGGCYLFRQAFCWDGNSTKTLDDFFARLRRGPYAHRADELINDSRWIQEQKGEAWQITSFDGLQLYADYYPHPENTGRTIMLVHGFHSSPLLDFGSVCYFYQQQGFDLLLIHQRNHGQSEGRYLTFGVKESRDVIGWCQKIIAKQGASQQIILDGMSMGAASVLMAAAREDLPDNVIGVVADCGFTSAADEFRFLLRQRHLPAFPILPAARIICRHRLGIDIEYPSTAKDAHRIKVPVLLVHGEADDFVPTEHSRRVYEALTCPKTIYTVPEAGHGMSYVLDPEGCKKQLLGFFDTLTDKR